MVGKWRRRLFDYDQILAHFVCLGNDIAIQKQSSQLVSEPTKNQHQDDGAEDHDVGDKDNDDDDAEKENKNKAKAKEDLNRAKRSFTHVAAVGETKAGNESGAKDVLLGRLSALLATPIREHAIGFTLRDNRLKVYVMAACGVFFTKLKTVTKENGELSTFLYRLIKHSDRLNEFSGGATTMSNVKIEKLLFRQRSACGRATSTYEITTGEGTSCKTRAMTITWVLGLHDSYLADIRNFIKEKRPRGLAPLVGFFRTEYRTLLAFLPGDESFEFRGVVPRAKEVIVHEECYKSLATVKDTKELARILEGAIQGECPERNRPAVCAVVGEAYMNSTLAVHDRASRALERRLHSPDVSNLNVMVDRHGDGILIDYNLAVKKTRAAQEKCRFGRWGTLPYYSRLLLSPETDGLVHERWHDIESFFYVASRIVFQSEPVDEPLFEKSNATRIWNMWCDGDSGVAFSQKSSLGSRTGFMKLLGSCASRWSIHGVIDLLTILKDNCSIAAAYCDLEEGMLEVKLCDLWDAEVMSYESIQTRLRALF
ncbi:BQ5605_C009g05405 [Microbotryum silenes-dioicae]|uniref:BQ5605_C009g05405 protein n=1 Tax=Microbotryum silenes-dioicae TaxID=796604 RepID=A0A2X0P8F2_9BASI|nr:BQ5605_C009g05405 [Microbotryum silenes-dioicae]